MGPGRFWFFWTFWTFWVCQPDMFFWMFGSLMAPSEFSFLLRMFAVYLVSTSSLKCVKFIEFYCRNFIFSLKTHFVKLSHLGSVLKAIMYFWDLWSSGSGQFVYFLEIWHFWVSGQTRDELSKLLRAGFDRQTYSRGPNRYGHVFSQTPFRHLPANFTFRILVALL